MNSSGLSAVGSCRVCGAENWHRFLDLGTVPLANSFVTDESVAEARFPLALMSCRECRLVSLDHVVDASELYGHYLYVSSPSRMIHEHMTQLADDFGQSLGLDASSLVVEIGSNNGDQLEKFERFGCSVLGIDPARNIASRAVARGIDTRTAFFTSAVAREVRAERGPADLILARHVIAHVDDVRDVIAGVRELLSADGLFALEVPYLAELLARRAFDTVYHEHLSYFLVGTLRRLLEDAGLRVIDVREFDVHGGSIVLTAAHAESGKATNHDRVDGKIRAEQAAGLDRDQTYDAFAAEVERLRAALRDSLRELAREGCVVAGYGASAKGVTLLTTSQVPAESLEFCSDTTPDKQGTRIPGLGVPVISPEQARDRKPDVYLLLAWNYRDEILTNEIEFLAAGGRFLVPIPEPRLIGLEESAELIGASS